MYEAEVNSSFESIDTIPADIRRRFAESREMVVARTTLPWGEHCTECVWPTCYTTCDLYTPRVDGACRQFVDGMVRIDHKDGLSPYLLKLRFKPWAKLWTVGNLDLQPLATAATRERLNMAIGAIGRNVPAPAAIKPRVLTKISYLRRRAAEDAAPSSVAADAFMIECFNPNSKAIDLTVTMRAANGAAGQFQTLVTLTPGYTRAKVAVDKIGKRVDLSRPFEVELVPNGSDDTVLYFGLLDFVKEREQVAKAVPTSPAKKWKCIVWDLDNTMWEGVLVEDGAHGLRIRSEVVEVIKALDSRGILHSIASKNNHDEAFKVLEAAGLSQYFLAPQIHWQPKSQSISQIARRLNIGIDTLAFVDDQPFEREEVKSTLPHVSVIDAADCRSLLSRPECDVPVTDESRNRRAMYREDEDRQSAQDAASGDYMGFLKSCDMKMAIKPLSQDNLKRVYELAQRTNQLNFSGNRYSDEQLADVMVTPHLDTYVIDCSDRFGQYGIVGFAIVDTREPRLLDLMFSCRVQSKRVEHAVLSHMLKRFVETEGRDFHANYRKTVKNAPGGKVFEEVGFEYVAEHDGVSSLRFRRGQSVPDDKIVEVRVPAPGASNTELQPA